MFTGDRDCACGSVCGPLHGCLRLCRSAAASASLRGVRPMTLETNHCPSCGATVTAEDAFCGECGHRTRPEPAPAPAPESVAAPPPPDAAATAMSGPDPT